MRSLPQLCRFGTDLALFLITAISVFPQTVPTATLRPLPQTGTYATGPDSRPNARLFVSPTVALQPYGLPFSQGTGYTASFFLNPANAFGKNSIAAQSILPAVAAGKVDRPVSSRVIVKFRNQTAQHLSRALSPAENTVNLADVLSIDRDLAALLSRHAVRKAAPVFAGAVRARRQQGRSETQLRNAMRQRFPARSARTPKDAKLPDLSSTYVFDLGQRSAQEVTETIRSLRSDSNVLSVEEDKVVQVFFMPNDPSYASVGSWGQDYADLHGLKEIGTTQAWDVTHGKGVVVAVIDTGIDYNHPDISANIWINPGEIPGNGVDDDNNGYIDDVRGWDFVGADSLFPAQDNDPFDGYFHGTHVAGIIAATGNNNLGVIGVAWEAKVMAVKGLDDKGSGYDSDLAKAIVYAVDNGADVINASWGAPGFSQMVTDAIEYAHANGVVFVAAAGNSTADAGGFSPANVPHAIAVSSLDPFGNLSFFSNFGSKVELAAPGEDILSLEAGTAGYRRLEGTSMAAPHVSGVAALIIAKHPTFSNEQVRQALRVSSTDLGLPGRDPSFGYGRVNAAQAVLVNQVLEAKIHTPIDGIKISAPITLTGSAGGLGFDHYVVDFGAGTAPNSWTTLTNSTASVANEVIGTLDPSTLADGIHTIRLRAFSTGGAVFSDQIQVEVDYIEITSPLPPPVYSLTKEVKPGASLTITGSAKGPSFQNYQLEWAPGVGATSGWSAVGITLSGSGLSPVANGVLGTWTPPPATLKGDYTIRLTVTNTGFSSQTLTAVFMQPALVSSGWPRFVPNVPYDGGVLPVHQADGSWRFIMSGTGNGPFSDADATLYSFAIDGTTETIALDKGSHFQSCVGNLDGQPGDEIVVTNGFDLKILASNLAAITTITPGESWIFGYDQVSLADLDNDGVPEIIAPARIYGNFSTGALYVYRADGTLFSNISPPAFATGVFDSLKVVAIDLNGDGRKEIVMAYENIDRNGYTLAAFNADGSAYAGWSPLFFPDIILLSLAAADLDHNGTNELVLSESNQADQNERIRVLNNTGAVRPGWPFVVGPTYGVGKIAIGDLDRDQLSEIVVVAESTISVLRDNGTAWCAPWSNGGNPPFNSTSVPLIADIDGDGTPEILVGLNAISFSDFAHPYHYSSLTSYRPDGSIQKSWTLFGAEGRQPYIVTPLVGDFNGDGQTDLMANVGLVEGGGINGMLLSSVLTCLTTGTSYNAAGSDWTGNLHDPQNSRNANSAAPVITTQPSDQTVLAGGTVILSAAASGEPMPAFQWKKNGTAISGATRGTLTFPAVLATDTGSYTLVASNLKGSVSSNSATLTVNKGTPVIIWPVPAPITYGSALSGTQLNATASVAGSFVYSPAAGAVPGAGTQTLSLTVTPTDSANYNVATKSVNLTVNKATPVITWANPAAITYGTALSATQLNATASVAGTFVYAPAAGSVLSAGIQSLGVTFTPTDSSNYNTATKSVSLTVKAIPVITWADPAAITYGTALSGTQLNATASVAGTFVYSPAAGVVPGSGSQSLSVTFTPTDSINYSATTKSVALTVNKATPVITWANPAAITYGTALSATQLNATASVAGTFVYAPAAGSVLSAGIQSLGVTFTPTDSSNYNTATKSVSLTVKAIPVITWADPAAITYGTALSGTQLNATASVAGTFVYSPALGSVPDFGTQNLSVTFTPADITNYDVATKSVSLTVAKGVPVISWNSPLAIPYGELLGLTQLNATANVPGTLVYSPVTGTLLNAGTQSLSVTFTPTDSAKYNATTKSVDLVVSKRPLVITTVGTSRVYGAANPAFAVAFTGFVNGDTDSVVTGSPSFFTTASSPSSVGTYPVYPSVGTLAANNYSFSLFLFGTITVTPAPLTVTAENKTKPRGAANPALTISYVGFVNGENVNSLTTQPTAATTAVNGSPAGVYPITLAGGVATNYSFNYVPGTLTVNPAGFPLFTLQPVGQVILAGQPATFTASADGVPAPTYQWQKDGVNISGANGSSYTITKVGAGSVGNYTVVATNSAGTATSNGATLALVAAPNNAVLSISVE